MPSLVHRTFKKKKRKNEKQVYGEREMDSKFHNILLLGSGSTKNRKKQKNDHPQQK